jgi:hypothetical protein
MPRIHETDLPFPVSYEGVVINQALERSLYFHLYASTAQSRVTPTALFSVKPTVADAWQQIWNCIVVAAIVLPDDRDLT